jgi:hypothetical protein
LIQSPRTTVDLIEELDREAPRFNELLLAVGFENTTIFVCASDANRLQTLNAAVAVGGEPVGFVGFTIAGSRVCFYRRPLEEFAEEDWVKAWLQGLIELAAESFNIKDFDFGSGWVN